MMGSKNKSLTAQIKDAERELLNHQQKFDVQSTMLIRTIHRQITPATPLLAAGIGFIIGELTRRHRPRAVPGKPRGTTTDFWKTALNLMTSLNTLNTALPLDLIMKRIYQPDASGQAYKRPLNPVESASCADSTRRERQ
ncbi:MAG: hypothetical protein PHG00_06840 [Methylococcales bacterium]|nr:hypothetical protein [Methylococcales bacterium]